ncbi:MAG: hypothetical protein ACRC2U_07100, partial [Aeromonas sp.]
ALRGSEGVVKITLQGLVDSKKQMERIEKGSQAVRNYEGVVYSRLPYAWGIEYGRHRKSGRLARKKGGAEYITSAINTVLSDADRALAEGLTKVTAPGIWVVRRLALWARRLARKNAPRGPKRKKRSYRLWRSISYQVRKK